jgi:hypothetical protein
MFMALRTWASVTTPSARAFDALAEHAQNVGRIRGVARAALANRPEVRVQRFRQRRLEPAAAVADPRRHGFRRFPRADPDQAQEIRDLGAVLGS